MVQFYYIMSVIISILLYFKLKTINFTNDEKSALKIIIIIPFLNIIIMILLLLSYFDIIEEEDTKNN